MVNAAQKTPPPDQDQRDIILHGLDQTLLVEAAAGTGKTTCLIGRMVNLLRTGACSVSTLAAVTFTRKATAELRTRFQMELERAIADATGAERSRLEEALSNVQQAYIGTIHSFCARLLRERPFEANVDPNFSELDQERDYQLRLQVWREYVATLIASDDAIVAELEQLGIQISGHTNRPNRLASELDELGLDAAELGPAFLSFAEFPDVEDWPAPQVPLPDLTAVQQSVREYLEHIETFDFPEQRGNDELMNRCEELLRKSTLVDFENIVQFMDLLALFRKTHVVQKQWPTKEIGKAERDRWVEFIETVAKPVQQAWMEYRYAACLRAIQPARDLYRTKRADANCLNFHDLLQMSAALLRELPEIRTYFRKRFTHLLVDEFQDTDPIQAEVMLLLTADDSSETDWQKCRPIPGSLFVVGDPKQSIYRFRRADIQTYSKVREIIEDSCGQVVQLSANFRTVEPIIRFVNNAFDRVFPSTASDFQPANCHLAAGRRDSAIEPCIQKLVIPAVHKYANRIVTFEADRIARTIRAAIDGDTAWKIARTPAEITAGLTPTPVPADFLIITKRKSYLSTYADALQKLDIVHNVTGGATLNSVPELRLLHFVLLAVTRPDNPVALVAVLRSAVFGVSDPGLYAFKTAGGRFSWQSVVPENIVADAEDVSLLNLAFERLRTYSQWLDQFPAGVVAERIAGDLGLIAKAAAANDGGMRAGSLMKAIELLRDNHGAVTAADFVATLERLIDRTDQHSGMTARSPTEAPVRIMNLHQCKGLEAPIVFLANPSQEKVHTIGMHIDRVGGRPQGYLPIYGPRTSEWSQSRSQLAMPANWDVFAQREQQFLDAEEQRLLYVAATRAGARLIVSQREGKNDGSPWEFFDQDLLTVPPIADPGSVSAAVVSVPAIDLTRHIESIDGITQRWQNVKAPTYALRAVTDLVVPVAKGQKPDVVLPQGTEWGTALHTLLEAAMTHPGRDLKALAISTREEHGMSFLLLHRILQTVDRVTKSALWLRALTCEQRLVEVNLSTLTTDGGLPTVLRGVIDLVFRDAGGWVIVDFKSDQVGLGAVDELVDYYRPQVDAYAEHWAKITGDVVVERGLFFTHTSEYRTVK